MRLLRLLFALCSMLFVISHCLEAVEKDNELIDYIKKQTDLTQLELKKWKLFWLKSAANPLATGLGFYALYQAGKFGYYVPTNYEEKITNVVKSLNIPALFADKFEGLAKNKFLWAAVGLYSADRIWSKLISSRIPSYYIPKIERFLKFCKPLPFAHKKCNSIKEFVEVIPDKRWCRYGVVSLQQGFDNLIDQADIAYSLLGQLINAGVQGKEETLSVLQDKVLTVKNNIIHNKMFITEESVQLRMDKVDMSSSDVYLQWLLVPFGFMYMMSRLTEK